MKKLFVFVAIVTLFIVGPKLCAALDPLYENSWISVPVPLGEFSGVALYDAINRESLVGAETVVVRFRRVEHLSITGGFVVDASHSGDSELNEAERELFEGTFFAGLRYGIPALSIKDVLHFGVFGGRNFEKGKNIAGIKCSLKFW